MKPYLSLSPVESGRQNSGDMEQRYLPARAMFPKTLGVAGTPSARTTPMGACHLDVWLPHSAYSMSSRSGVCL